MAKLQFLQAVLVVWCVVIVYNTSEAVVQNEEQFKKFIENKVISKFQPWAEYNNNSQFAVELLMDTDSDWNSFEYLPVDPTQYTTSRSQPGPNDLTNYYAALRSKRGGHHSEKRLINNFQALLKAYKDHIKNHGGIPRTFTVVLYTWYLPCSRRIEGRTDCTILLTRFAENIRNLFKKMFGKKKLAQMERVHVIVAYTKEDKEGKLKGCTCNLKTTQQLFRNVGIDLVHVPVNQGVLYKVRKLITKLCGRMRECYNN